MGSLQRLDSPRDDLHACGVALIAPNWGITAGHCTRGPAGSDGQPTSGHPVDWNVRFNSTQTDTGGELVKVAQYIQLNQRPFDRDVALLRFDRPVNGAPIQIADAPPPPGSDVQIMGWGQTCRGFDDDPSCLPQKQLKVADTQVQDKSTCAAGNGEPGSDSLVCVGAVDGSIRAENMDSGGPAIVDVNGEKRIFGTTEGGGESKPTSYTDITQFRDWINGYVSGTTPLPNDTPFPSDRLVGTASIGGFCSGTVVKSANSRPDDPAMVLTVGRCGAQTLKPGESLVNQPSNQKIFLKDAHGETTHQEHATRMVYATMTGSDLALYKLTTSYAQLAAKNLPSFTFAQNAPAPGDPIRVLAGKEGKDWSCSVEAIVPELRENGYSQFNSIRYASEPGCGTDNGRWWGGNGAALVNPTTGEFIGVHSTSNDAGLECTENNPCEVNPDGTTTAVEGRAYGQPTAVLNSCLVAGSEYDPSRPGCGGVTK